jgi:hypothetical protein
MLFRFVGNTERHAKLRIAMSADRSIRKGSSRTLKAITNQNGRVETILEQRVEWYNINGRRAQEGCDCHSKRNAVDLAIAFDSHAYADRIGIIIARAQETKSAVVPPLWTPLISSHKSYIVSYASSQQTPGWPTIAATSVVFVIQSVRYRNACDKAIPHYDCENSWPFPPWPRGPPP